MDHTDAIHFHNNFACFVFSQDRFQVSAQTQLAGSRVDQPVAREHPNHVSNTLKSLQST